MKKHYWRHVGPISLRESTASRFGHAGSVLAKVTSEMKLVPPHKRNKAFTFNNCILSRNKNRFIDTILLLYMHVGDEAIICMCTATEFLLSIRIPSGTLDKIEQDMHGHLREIMLIHDQWFKTNHQLINTIMTRMRMRVQKRWRDDPCTKGAGEIPQVKPRSITKSATLKRQAKSCKLARPVAKLLDL